MTILDALRDPHFFGSLLAFRDQGRTLDVRTTPGSAASRQDWPERQVEGPLRGRGILDQPDNTENRGREGRGGILLLVFLGSVPLEHHLVRKAVT